MPSSAGGSSNHVIEQPDDIYFLELEDILRRARTSRLHPSLSRAGAACDVRASRQRAAAGPVLDQAPIAPGPVAAPLSGTNVLRGTGASPGVASGRVRVIESPDDVAAFVSGEVLVTPTPNPAWTPMYRLHRRS